MPEYKDLDAERKKLYDAQIALHGRITNMKKTLLNDALSFKVLMEWYPLRDKVREFAGEFATNVFAYSISAENDCLICSTFFRKILKDAGKDPDKLELDRTEALLADYGRALVSKEIPEKLFARLKAAFSEEQIVILTAFGAMMIATNLINSALEVPLDEYLTPYTRR
jgi:hypothetical protein